MDVKIGEKTGLVTVAAEHDPASNPPDFMDVEQLDLLPLRKPKAEIEDENLNSASRGRGRPRGAQNKSTEIWRNYILSRYPSPLEGLASIAFRPTVEFAQDLLEAAGCAPGAKPSYDRMVELLKVQASAMNALLPYLHQKIPQQVDMGDGGMIQLIINENSAAASQAVPVRDLGQNFLDLEFVENQGVSERKNQEFNENQSNDFLKSGGDIGFNTEKETD